MSSFDDIRRWYGHYGVGGAPQSVWSLDDLKVRRLSQRASGANSLGDTSKRLAGHCRESIGTTTAFKKPGSVYVELLDAPSSPLYQEQNESYSFGDPWGKEYWGRCITKNQVAQSSGLFHGTNFYYNKNATIKVSFDYVARFALNASNEGGFSVVVVEYASGYGSGASKVIYSFTDTSSSTAIKKFSQTMTCDASKPYKLVSLQQQSPRYVAGNQYQNMHIANMTVEEV